MAGELVLVTGATGFLAQHVVAAVLAAPDLYRVRGTVRSLAASKQRVYDALPSAADRARVELVEVPDTTSSDLTAALDGVTYVLHVASPYIITNVTDVDAQLLHPAVEGTLNTLRFAAKSPTVRRVVVTSSFAAVSDFTKGGPNRPGHVYTPQDWQPFGRDEALAQGGAVAYSASKKLAEKAAWDFVAEHTPPFDLATINPPMIYGSSLPWATRKTLNTSSSAIYNLISKAPEMPGDRLPLFCSAPDVATAHVRAMAVPEAGGKRFLLCGGAFNWGAAVHHIAKTFPDLKPRLPKGWEQSTVKGQDSYARLDTSLAKNLLHLKFDEWEETLDLCIKDLLHLESLPQWDA